jgi:SAM-dependent methyltransferase
VVELLIAETFLWMTRRSPRLRRSLFRGLFGLVAGSFADATWWHHMNYGFAPLSDQDHAPVLLPGDESERYPINLYHHVAAGEVEGRDVLEVGCGRGGGSSYIARYLKPRRIVGVDVSHKVIDFCRKVHRADNLEYRHGDAEALPFADNSFDVVVNVESSLCYGHIDVFFGEVARVLRPDGYLLLADIRLAEEVAHLDAAVGCSSLRLISRRDITENVVEALVLDSGRRSEASREGVPRPFRKWFDIFSGVEGTRIPVQLRSREMFYLSYRLQKPKPVEEARGADLESTAQL